MADDGDHLYADVDGFLKGERIAALAVVHLKKDLDAAPVDWRDCEDPNRPGDQLPASATANPRTTYGVWKAHQARLAEIRTDLDVFSDIEAAALMASGYMAMNQEVNVLARDVPALTLSDQRHTWFFTPVVRLLGDRHDGLNEHLKAGSVQFLRLTKLDAGVRVGVWAAGVLVLVALAVLLWKIWGYQVSVGWLVLTIGGMILPYVAPALGRWRWSLQLIDPVGTIRSRVGTWSAVLVTWIAARWVVPRLTRRYLNAGRLEQLQIR